MSYHTGAASSYAQLQSAIEGVLTDKGWTTHGAAIFSHAGLFVQLASDEHGCWVRVGTGTSGGALTGEIPRNNSRAPISCARVGVDGEDVHDALRPSLPFAWHIYAFNQPAEVYVVIQWGERFMHMGFGQSALIASAAAARGLSAEQASGNWLMGTIKPVYRSRGQVYLWYPRDGLGYWMGDTTASCAPWACSHGMGSWLTAAIHTGLSADDGASWGGLGGGWVGNFPPYGKSGHLSLWHLDQSRIAQLSSWNAGAAMWPITVVQTRPENFSSLVFESRVARYLRIDHYEPLELITIGHETWQVLPWLKKEPRWPLGGSTSSGEGNPHYHSGCMGWAILHSSTAGDV